MNREMKEKEAKTKMMMTKKADSMKSAKAECNGNRMKKAMGGVGKVRKGEY